MPIGQPAFQYTQPQLLALSKLISHPRLQHYYGIVRKSSDQEDRLRKAVHLYESNTLYSEAMYTVVQGFEVTLRNAIHIRLKADHQTEEWWDKIELKEFEKESVAKAKRDIVSKAQPVTPDRVVGELSFGFWVTLFSFNYEALLWDASLKAILPKELTRGNVYSRFKDLKTFRNRIAHHNRIMDRNPKVRDAYKLFLDSIGWLNPIMRDWVAATNRVEQVLPPTIGQLALASLSKNAVPDPKAGAPEAERPPASDPKPSASEAQRPPGEK
jgi:hypothetical protein